MKEMILQSDEDYHGPDDEDTSGPSTSSRRNLTVSTGPSLFKKAQETDSIIPLSKLVILPWSKGYKTWWSVTVFCALLTVFTETYIIAFTGAGLKPYNDGSSILELCLVGIFAIDIMVSFLLAYYDESNNIVLDPKQIAKHYLSKVFWIDLVGVFPFYALALAMAGEMGEDNSLTQYLSLLRLVRLVRLRRMVLMFDILQYSSKISLMTLTVTRNFTASLVWCHFNACAFYFIARAYDYSPDQTWIGEALADGSMKPMDRYLTCLYFAIVTFATVGYGDYSPVNAAEKIWGMLFMLINLVFAAWFIGSITLLIVKSDEKTGMYRDLLAKLEKFGELHSLDSEFQKGLKSQLKLEFNNREVDEEEIMSRFPTAVRRKVLRKLYLPDLAYTRLVKGLRQQFLDAFLSACKVEITSPGEDLVQCGTIASDLYFLVDGTVKLMPDTTNNNKTFRRQQQQQANRRRSSSNGTSGCPVTSIADSELRARGYKIIELDAGQFINDVGFFTESPQRETIRTKTVCRTLTFSRADFKLIAADYPDCVTTLLNNLLDKIERQILATNKLNVDTTDKTTYTDEVHKHVQSVQQETDATSVKALIQAHKNKLKDEATTKFLFAASRGDTGTVESMCENGFHPDTRDYDQRTALMIAGMKGHTDTVNKLIEFYADPNLVDMHGSSALYESAVNGHNETVQALLDHGAELCLSDGQAASKLCQAVFDGDITMLRWLLKAKINPDAGDYDGRTAAHIAASEGNLVALKLLVEYGASVLSVRDRWNKSVKDEAQKTESARQMLEFLQSLERTTGD